MITHKIKPTINEKKSNCDAICRNEVKPGCGEVIKETKKPVALPPFILEEMHYKRKNNDTVKSNSNAKYKLDKINLIRTKIRSRYWYNIYI